MKITQNSAIPKIWKYWITSTMSWHWDANCNIENPSVCFILATTYSNLSVFCQNKIPGQGQPSIKPLSESLGMFCARKQTIGYWSSPSFLVEDVWQDQDILIARAEILGIDLKITMYFYTLAELGWQCLILFFVRNRGKLLWFKSSRNESNNILDEYYIAFFLSGV